MQFVVVSNIHVPFDWTATGGSEEYHIQLCEQLAKRGHNVISYAPLPMGVQTCHYHGVWWREIKNLDQSIPGVWIIQRDPTIARSWKGDRSKQLLCFTAHDLDYQEPQWTQFYDVILADSEIHARYLRLTHQHPKVIALGAYPQLQRAGEVGEVKRNPKRILWSSSYDRGLEYLLMIYERAKELVPDLQLAVCHGWESIDRAMDSRNGKYLLRWKEKLVAEMGRLGVEQLGRLPSSVDVWREFAKSGMWVYPTCWPETACQSIMEAQAFGAIPVFTPFWGLAENGLHGIRIYGDPYTDKLVRARFVQTVAELAIAPGLQENIRKPMVRQAREEFQFSKIVDRVENLAGEKTEKRRFFTNGWMKDSNRTILEQLIKEHDIKTVVEIGSFLGESAIWFAQRVDKVICVDPWYEGAEEKTGNNLVETLEVFSMPRDFYQAFLDNIERAGLSNKVETIRGKSSDVWEKVPEADLVYVDGDHSYDGCKADLLNYEDKARKILCGDDYAVRDGWGVVEAVMEVLPEHQAREGFWWFVKEECAVAQGY